jgi:hypothetical protein
MFRKSNNLFLTRRDNKKKSMPIPIFSTNNNSISVIRNDLDPAYTIGLAQKYQRSSGLEK